LEARTPLACIITVHARSFGSGGIWKKGKGKGEISLEEIGRGMMYGAYPLLS